MVDYNKIAINFSKSRKNMSWPELEYFFSFLKTNENILDIWCGSGRLLEQYNSFFSHTPKNYVWIDLSENLLKEARREHPSQEFRCMNMLEVDSLSASKYDAIFLVASFHHLAKQEERNEMMKKLYNILSTDGKIFMTHWNLLSPLNYKKYAHSEIQNSTNDFGSKDFNIKFWETMRYYHSFDLSELEYLARNNNFTIVENKIFEWEKNIITILKK